MASDIPDAQFRSGTEMARTLVTYIECPRRVQSAVAEVFGGFPIDRIRKYRSEHLAHINRPPERFCRTDHHDAIGDSLALDPVNKRFLDALARERGGRLMEDAA